MLYYERKLKKKGFDVVIGVDEAGRGPLAGPIVAAAVRLKKSSFKNRIDDSKKLTSPGRDKAFLEIVKKTDFAIGIVSEGAIDRLNIAVANRLAMEQAVGSLINKLKHPKSRNIHIIVDGNIPLKVKFPYTNIIKGDSKSKTIACASILAKVTRDRIMDLYDKMYPQYRFSKHKGYGTKEHRDIIKRIGFSQIHRKTFSCV
ncbi:MAG: ribonuclease HII [Candidatus Omnitrophota bacterium]